MAKKVKSDELIKAIKELVFQNEEKEKRAAELVIANKELAFQNDEKEKRAAELIIANKELIFQNNEKEKRSAELIIANKELIFQKGEKEKRAAEFVIAAIELDVQSKEKKKQEIANKELEALSDSAKLASQYARSLIEASRDPLFTISPQGKITDLNHASSRVTGETREKMIGTDFFIYFTEPEKAKIGYQEVFEKGFVTDYPLTIIDGELTPVLFNGSTYKDDQGNVIGAVVVAREITEQKRFEKELTEAKNAAELSTKFAEQAKLKAEKSTRIAEDAVKAKQQFLSNMSHEIRTPMNAIIGFTKVVLKTELTDKQKEYLSAIKISGDALIVLINDILDLAKVESGKMSFEKIPFKLEESISAMMHLFENKVQEKNLKLTKKFDARIPEVLIGDPVRLNQIILNLVSNSIKFTSEGEISVDIKLLNEDDDQVNLEFAVSDTGIGIEATKIDKIFENFQQASSGTSRIYGGTGLGLAIVKQLVESQDGQVKVKSKIGQGSIFSFELGFQKTKLSMENQIDSLEMEDELKNIKVLVVEDIVINQLLMKTLLDDFGFDRDIASNGKIAVEMLENKSYDIILMDLQMPVMNGFEATEYIRKKLNSKIPIIALTADVTTVDITKCRAAGMNDYIAKPVDEKILYNKIVQLVKKQHGVKMDVVEDDLIEKRVDTRCIDLNYLMKRTKSNPALMMEMISLFLEQTPTLITAMKKGLKESDWELLNGAVHKMIPSFSIMGISNDYENMAKRVVEFTNIQKMSGEIQELVLKIENVCTQACIELEEEYHIIKNKSDERKN